MRGLNGKSVIVTGGGSGIGRAAVELLVEAGCLVTVADLNEPGGHEVVTTANGRGPGRAIFVHTDVTAEADVAAMVAASVAMAGRLDGAINSAGVVQHSKLLHELDASEWDACVNVNLRGMFFCMKHQIGAMLKTGGGAIVAVSSIAAVMAFNNSAEYCSSKAGVHGLVRSTALDYGAVGIRANALLPGATNTPLSARARAMRPKDAPALTIPSNRRAEPVEIARGAVWMISDDASYMNGACLSLDGGMSIA
jgi:2,5-dichloro-2,5-cyclohexadiene-1,4-diol dehydrogenase 1